MIYTTAIALSPLILLIQYHSIDAFELILNELYTFDDSVCSTFFASAGIENCLLALLTFNFEQLLDKSVILEFIGLKQEYVIQCYRLQNHHWNYENTHTETHLNLYEDKH